MNRETVIQNKILRYLKDLEKEGYPLYVERRQAGGFSYKKGVADVYFVYDGYHVEVECKTESGKLKVLQEKWRDYCIERGIGYICARSLEDVKKVVDEMIKN